jgi:class 3 adenylate cyclase/tetratricopeptide (TPR) repeat protein
MLPKPLAEASLGRGSARVQSGHAREGHITHESRQGESPAHPDPPDRLIADRYEVVGPGPAGMAEAIDLQQERMVALRVTRVDSEERGAALRDRARELLGIRPHPALAVIRDAFLDGQDHIVVTDWVEGTPLEEVLERPGGLSQAETLEALGTLAAALEHLHGHRPPVVHGGLWPGAIVLTPEGRAVSVAFGMPGEEIPLPYRAPEGTPSPASDVLALAATAHRLLTESPPHDHRPRWEGLPRIESRIVERLLARAMSPDPAQRPRSARGFIEDLRARLEGALPAGTVTLLLTDVQGSTRLWEEHPDAMRPAMARHDAILAEVIERHGGRMPKDQGEGDSTFSAFSVAADAVACALEAQRALATEPWPPETPVRVRMAIHTGQLQPHRRNYRGSDANRCARLRSIAHGGQTLLTSATAGLIRGSLPAGATLKDLGPHRLKDVTEPEEVFTLLHPDLPSDYPPLVSLGRVETAGTAPEEDRFVGRDEEMHRLLGSLDEAMAGRARLSLVVGDAGMGKSRIASELATHAQRRRHALVLWGRCYEHEGAPPYWPWTQVIRSYVAESSAEELRAEMGPGAVDIARVAPEVAAKLPGLPSPSATEPDTDRFRLFDSMTSFLRAAARERPLVLVLDDLHWADRPSLLLLEFLARELGQARVLLLGAYREPGSGSPLRQSLGELFRQPATERIALGGLTQRQLARFIELTTGTEPPARLTEVVFRRSEGNPFYLREIVRLLQQQHRLDQDGDRDAGAEAWKVAVPDTVREVIVRRLAPLSPETRGILEAASVAGREFRADVVAAAMELPSDSVLDRLDEAVAARIVVEEDTVAYAFTHALIRETLYEELPSGRRTRLHLGLARSLESLFGGDPETHAADLAHHFLRAAPVGGAAEALRYLLLAADVAITRLAYEDATQLYRSALKVMESGAPADDAQRCDVLLAYGEALWHSADVPAAKRAFERAAEIARRLGDGQRLARAALGYGDLWVEVGRVDEVGVSLLEEAMASVPGSDDPMRARLMARLAMELSSAPEAEARRSAVSAEAIEVARRSGDRPSLGYALLARRHAMWGPDHLEERHAVVDEGVRLADETGDRRLSLRGRALRLIDLLEMGDMEQTDREIEAFVEMAETLRSPVYGSVAAIIRASRATFAGRFDEAERSIQEVFEWGERISRISTTQAGWAQVLLLRKEQGALADYVGLLEGLVEQQPEIPGWRAGLSLVHVELENLDEARRHFDILAGEGFDALPRDGAWLPTMASLAEVCAVLGDRPRAEDLYHLLHPFAGRNVFLGFTTPVNGYGAAARYLGLAAATMGPTDEADRLFADGEAMNERMGAEPWLARTRHDHARMLLARGGPGDPARAEALLDLAQAAAERLGMAGVRERSERLRKG